MNYKLLLIQLLYVVTNVMHTSKAAGILGQRSMVFISSSVKSNSKYVVNCTTNIAHTLFNLDYVLLKQLDMGYRSTLDFQIRMRDAKRYQTLFTYDYDVCKILNGLKRSSLLKTWYKNALKHSNLMPNCPIPEGHYYVHNMTLASDNIPAYLNAGDYRMSFYNYYGKRKTKTELFIMLVAVDIQLV